ncbi:hypothetical protein ACWGF3_14855 [Streptomyces xanthophaeus]
MDIPKQLQSSRIALRLAGSRKEVQQPHEHYLGQAIDGEDEQARARRASDDARLAACESVKSSPYAEALGATGHAPVLDVLAQRLADMRQQRVPEQAQAKDALDERKLGKHHGVAGQRAGGHELSRPRRPGAGRAAAPDPRRNAPRLPQGRSRGTGLPRAPVRSPATAAEAAGPGTAAAPAAAAQTPRQKGSRLRP